MAYIGNKPTVGNFQICDAISVVNGQAAYTMQVGSVNVIPQSANHMIVSLNGTIQKPNSSFTVSGSTITFASNLVTNDVIDFIQILGDVLDLGVPSDATVSLAKLTATGTKDATTFLRGDNTFDTPPLGGITMSQQWRLSSNLVGDANPISSNLEIVDTGGYGGIGSSMTESSGIFTFPSTVIYLIYFNAVQQCLGTGDYVQTYIQTTTDNSSYYDSASGYFAAANTGTAFQSGTTDFMFDVTNTSTHKARFRIRQGNTGNQILGNSSYNYTTMTFIRLGDT